MPTNTRCRIPHHALVGIDFLSLIPHKLPFQPFHMPEVDHKHRSTRKQPGRHIHIHQHIISREHAEYRCEPDQAEYDRTEDRDDGCSMFVVYFFHMRKMDKLFAAR